MRKDRTMSEDKPSATAEYINRQQRRAAECIAAYDTIQQLADRLGCDVEAVTVENLVALVEAAKDVANWLPGCCPASDMNALETTLAPFKREVR
jgi:hypothetical protein